MKKKTVAKKSLVLMLTFMLMFTGLPMNFVVAEEGAAPAAGAVTEPSGGSAPSAPAAGAVTEPTGGSAPSAPAAGAVTEPTGGSVPSAPAAGAVTEPTGGSVPSVPAAGAVTEPTGGSSPSAPAAGAVTEPTGGSSPSAPAAGAVTAPTGGSSSAVPASLTRALKAPLGEEELDASMAFAPMALTAASQPPKTIDVVFGATYDLKSKLHAIGSKQRWVFDYDGPGHFLVDDYDVFSVNDQGVIKGNELSACYPNDKSYVKVHLEKKILLIWVKDDSEAEMKIPVNVMPPYTGVTLSNDGKPMTLKVGDGAALSESVLDLKKAFSPSGPMNNENYFWSSDISDSSPGNIVSVDQNGHVTAVKAGTEKVKFEVRCHHRNIDGHDKVWQWIMELFGLDREGVVLAQATAEITVTDAPVTVAVAPGTQNLKYEGSAELTATVSPIISGKISNIVYKWTSEDANLVKVAQSEADHSKATVTALNKVGQAKVNCEVSYSVGSQTKKLPVASTLITVQGPVSIQVKADKESAYKGDTVTFTANILPQSSNQDVDWGTAPDGLEQLGNVEQTKDGSKITYKVTKWKTALSVTATSKEGFDSSNKVQASKSINISKPAMSITASGADGKPLTDIKVGSEITFKADFQPAAAAEAVSWSGYSSELFDVISGTDSSVLKLKLKKYSKDAVKVNARSEESTVEASSAEYMILKPEYAITQTMDTDELYAGSTITYKAAFSQPSSDYTEEVKWQVVGAEGLKGNIEIVSEPKSNDFKVKILKYTSVPIVVQGTTVDSELERTSAPVNVLLPRVSLTVDDAHKMNSAKVGDKITYTVNFEPAAAAQPLKWNELDPSIFKVVPTENPSVLQVEVLKWDSRGLNLRAMMMENEETPVGEPIVAPKLIIALPQITIQADKDLNALNVGDEVTFTAAFDSEHPDAKQKIEWDHARGMNPIGDQDALGRTYKVRITKYYGPQGRVTALAYFKQGDFIGIPQVFKDATFSIKQPSSQLMSDKEQLSVGEVVTLNLAVEPAAARQPMMWIYGKGLKPLDVQQEIVRPEFAFAPEQVEKMKSDMFIPESPMIENGIMSEASSMRFIVTDYVTDVKDAYEVRVKTFGLQPPPPPPPPTVVPVPAKMKASAVAKPVAKPVVDYSPVKESVIALKVSKPGITLSPGAFELNVGSAATDLSKQLTATVVLENKEVAWSTGNPAVATVDSKGLVTAVGAGSTVITAHSVESPVLKALGVVHQNVEMNVPVTVVVKNVPPVNPPIVITTGGRDRDARTVASNTVNIQDELTPLGSVNFLEPYMSGYPNKQFKPKQSMTRAETAAMLARILKLDVKNVSGKTIKDVSSKAWYAGAVKATVKAGLMTVGKDGKFRPNAMATRGDLAAAFAKYWEIKGIEVDSASAKLSDTKGHWAEKYINQAVNAHLMSAYADGSFKPNAYAPREQVVVIVNKMIARPSLNPESPSFADVGKDYWASGDIEASAVAFKNSAAATNPSAPKNAPTK